MDTDPKDRPNFISRLRSGENDAWKLALDPLYKVALATIRNKLNHSEEPDYENLAADVLSEVQSKLNSGTVNSLNRIETFYDLRNMTSCIATNRSIDYLRKKKARPDLKGVDDLSQMEIPDTRGKSKWELDHLLHYIDQLPPPVPELLIDRYVMGLNAGEVAAKHKLNYNTSNTYLAKALKMLRDML